MDDSFKDKVIFPGFIDPHTHFRMPGVVMGLTSIGPIDQQGPKGFNQGLKTREAVLNKLREAVQRLKAWMNLFWPGAAIIADPTALSGAIDTLPAITLQAVITIIDAARSFEDSSLFARGVRAAC